MAFRSALIFLAFGVMLFFAFSIAPEGYADPAILDSHENADDCPADSGFCGNYCLYSVCSDCTRCDRLVCSTCCDTTCSPCSPPDPDDPDCRTCTESCWSCNCYTVYYDCRPCITWDWFIKDDDDRSESDDFILPNTGVVHLLETPPEGYDCVDEEGDVVEVPTVVLPPTYTPGPTVWMAPVMPTDLLVVPGQPGSANLSSVNRIADQIVTFSFAGDNGRRPILYRFWPSSGAQPPLPLYYPFRSSPIDSAGLTGEINVSFVSTVRHAFFPFRHDRPEAHGLYAFQLAFVDPLTGDPEMYSNVVHHFLGDEAVSAANAPPALVPPSQQTPHVPKQHPTPTALPTPDHGLSRPAPPVVVSVTVIGTTDAVEVDLGGYVGQIQYRRWVHNGFRPLEGNEPWREYDLDASHGGVFEISPLKTRRWWTFAFRVSVSHDVYVGGIFDHTVTLVSESAPLETVLVWGEDAELP